ncbi:MAG: hypothetical protein JWO03_2121 [Bacteroidetes bacterium]|nr:hypothetical protein [Bacteroidota bacterium]
MKMNNRKRLQTIFSLTIIILFLIACSHNSGNSTVMYKVKTEIDSIVEPGYIINIHRYTYTYDGQGRIFQVFDSFSSINIATPVNSYESSNTRTYSYSSNAITITATSDGSSPYTYKLNAQGLVTEITDRTGTMKDVYQYDAQGYRISDSLRMGIKFISTISNGNEISVATVDTATSFKRFFNYSLTPDLRDFGKAFQGKRSTNLPVSYQDSCSTCPNTVVPTRYELDSLGRVTFESIETVQRNVFTYY